LTWSLEGLNSAQEAYKRLKNIIGGLDSSKGVNKKYLNDFEKAINNDLDMPGAMAVLWKLVRDKKADGKLGAIKKMDEVLGLDLLKAEKKVKVPAEIKKLADSRLAARKEKDWAKSDKLRDELKKKGWVVEDVGDGFELRKV
jgi:cysteinyl-tRNA synthetase